MKLSYGRSADVSRQFDAVPRSPIRKREWETIKVTGSEWEFKTLLQFFYSLDKVKGKIELYMHGICVHTYIYIIGYESSYNPWLISILIWVIYMSHHSYEYLHRRVLAGFPSGSYKMLIFILRPKMVSFMINSRLFRGINSETNHYMELEINQFVHDTLIKIMKWKHKMAIKSK